MRALLIYFIALAMIGVVIGDSLTDLLQAYVRQLESGENIFKRTPSSCSGKWEELKDSSTMCLFEDNPSAKDCGITEEDKKNILHTHNRLRAAVSPSQRNMMKMYWNDDLALVAQKWARQCRSEHDTNDNRQIPGWGQEMFIGQSWASGAIYNTWEKAIEEGWYGEVKFFNYGSDFHSGVVGHYTQTVRDQANLVGCGKCMCSQGPLWVCNYHRGNSQDKGRPYFDGTPCSDCKSCVDKLCDCGDKLCKNNGTLSSKTCECECVGKWKGDDCGEYDCPDSDESYCGEGKHFDPPKCKMYYNVPKKCPYMCGLCKGKQGKGKGKGEGPILITCNYESVSDVTAECKRFVIVSSVRDGGSCHHGCNRVCQPWVCKDMDEQCPVWASWGHCDKEGGYTQIKCKKSCKLCQGNSDEEPTECKDDNDKCQLWASWGHCKIKNGFAQVHCKRSCKLCEGGLTPVDPPKACEDSNASCADWATHGHCESNPSYMKSNCRKSCKTC